MTELHQISVTLSEGQKLKLTKAYRNREEISLRLSKNALSGSDVLMVPMNTVKRLAKAKTANRGMVITISKNNIRRQTGSGIFSSILPVLKNVAPTIGKTLGLSALAGLASEGASQIVKKISGGQATPANQMFQVPNKNLYMLAQMGNLLTKGQIGDLARAHKLGEDLLFRLTQRQVGSGIDTLLASIGIPMIIDALKGGSIKGRGGVRMGKSDGGGGPRIGMPMAPPPFIGTWETRGRGRGKKKVKKPSPNQKPKFHKDIPMSNFDLLDWCKYLKIPIENVLSRDQTVPHQHKLALFIYNLEPHYMSGSHWVTTYVRDGTINYFDSFGMPPFQELVNHAKEKNLNLLHQNRQIQNLYTTTCGYFCLYFLNEMHKGVDYFDLLQVFSFDTEENEKFIEDYFSKGTLH